MIDPRSTGFDATFSIAGSFDRTAASRLLEQILALPPDRRVLVDFGRARDVGDLALVELAGALVVEDGPRVILRGLTHHHERLLDYMGMGGFPRLAGSDDAGAARRW
jgi:hypothetical protein